MIPHPPTSVSRILFVITLVLYIPHYILAFCPPPCQCNNVALSVSCTSSRVEVLPITLNPGIHRLQLQHNNIRAVDAALGFYAQLHYIDLSHNQLISLPDRGFIQQKKLVELRLSHNKIFKISNKTFEGLKTVIIVSLRKNFIEELEDWVFIGLSAVEELDLGQNRIISIGQHTFSGMDNLRILYLDDNDLQTIHPPSFIPLPHLAELDLSNNDIKKIPPKSFYPIKNLYSLDLHGCQIKDISQDAFLGLNALHILKLQENRLDTVPSKQLSILDRLEELSLGNNNISIIPPQALPGLRKLRKLDLSDSQNLAFVSMTAFQDISDLETLMLSGCKSVRLEKGSLLYLTELRTLHLDDMGLSQLDKDLVQWKNLDTINLAYNPLNCDCNLAWLNHVLTNTSLAQCKEPQMMAGKSVSDIPARMMMCDKSGEWARQGIVAGVCVLAGVITSLVIVMVVHCQRLTCGLGSVCFNCEKSKSCDTVSCDKCPVSVYNQPRTLDQLVDIQSSGNRPVAVSGSNIYYRDRSLTGQLEDKLDSLYYSSDTEYTYCHSDTDYFLSLSKNTNNFKTITVCEL